MIDEIDRLVAPGPREGTVLTEQGEVLVVPAGWALLEAGDGPLTKRAKALGPSWVVRIKKGRRMISLGIWTEAGNIEQARREITKLREQPDHQRRQAAARVRRERQQDVFVTDFQQALLDTLAFHPRHLKLAQQIAELVSLQASPVSSGTVARAQRLSLAVRAEKALIAWMRHQVTDYERMSIPRIRGARRKVRQGLARQSLQLLVPYRCGEDPPDACPLQRALAAQRSSALTA